MIKSKAFALEVIRACKVLREARCESALINQFLRSGTSIGANIREAFYAHGKADFVAKLHIALKECSETEYWLELLIEGGYYHDKSILDRCVEVMPPLTLQRRMRNEIQSPNERHNYKDRFCRFRSNCTCWYINILFFKCWRRHLGILG